MRRGGDLLSTLLAIPSSEHPLPGTHINRQSQVVRLFWKARSVGTNLTSEGRIFQRTSGT